MRRFAAAWRPERDAPPSATPGAGHFYRPWRSALVLIACAAAWARFAGPRPALAMYDESRRPLALIPVPDGFTLSYIHSINLSPVDEDFAVDSGSLLLERMLFEQLSTGMPSGDEDGFAVEGGKFVTRPMRRMRDIQLRVSPVPGHTLSVSGTTRPLTRWAPVGGLLVLSAAALPPGALSPRAGLGR